MRDGWLETNLGKYIHINTGKLDVNAASEFGEYPFFTCSRETYRIDEAAFEGESVLVAGNGDLNVKYFDGKFNAYQRTYVLNSVDRKILTNRFLFLYMQTYIEYLRSETRGTVIQYLKKGQFTDAKIKLPPLLEQKRIVDLISSVDSYIQTLHQQLETAKKSRNAVLHDLLAMGGDDWVASTLGEVAVLNPSEPALSNSDHFAPMDAVHVGKRWVQYTEERRDRNGARARAGDVLFARITPCLENGKVAQVQSELKRCGGSTEFIVVRGTEKCTSDFLYFWCTLKENRDKAAELMTGTTGRQRLSWQDLGSLSLWLPSITDQERIVSYISEFDSLIESTESAITQAQNLRSGLLSDLLSGDHEIPASYDKVIGAA
jgi:type I restriction enzyme S subunit